jgi:CheY-like chemotaxis protein
VIEDNMDHARIIAFHLEFSGFGQDFELVPSMKEAKSFLAKQENDLSLILLDLNILDRTALETVQDISQLIKYGQVVVLSSSSELSVRELAIKSSASQFLVKAEIFSEGSLGDVLHSLMK